MTEANYQTRLIKKLEKMFPGCFIVKNDSTQNQGIPDLLILFKDSWAMLELKRARNAAKQKNQDYHVQRFHGMSFASFIHPQNEEQVLSDLQSTFGVGRKTRVSKSQ